MRRLIPYIIFVVLYLGLQLAALAVLDRVGYGEDWDLPWWVLAGVSAPIALFVATRAGAVSVLGIAIATTLTTLLVLFTAFVVLRVLAVQAGASTPLLESAHNYWAILASAPLVTLWPHVATVLIACFWALIFRGRPSQDVRASA